MTRYYLPLTPCSTCGHQVRPIVVDDWLEGYTCTNCGVSSSVVPPLRLHPMLTELAKGAAGCGDT